MIFLYLYISLFLFHFCSGDDIFIEGNIILIREVNLTVSNVVVENLASNAIVGSPPSGHFDNRLNDGYYGPGWLANSDTFFVMAFNQTVFMTGFAFGRDSMGVNMTGYLGTYTIMYTQVNNPTIDTGVTEVASTGFKTLATIDYVVGNDPYLLYRRHEFSFIDTINATGFRMNVSSGIIVDEIEIFGAGNWLFVSFI